MSAIAAHNPPHEPVFAEPWQAQAFAMAVHLHARGLYTWTEWAQALAEQIASEPQPEIDHDNDSNSDNGNDNDSAAYHRTYYRHWLAALECLVAAKGAASAAELSDCAVAWDHAAGRTPHGEPIVLRPSDYRARGRGVAA